MKSFYHDIRLPGRTIPGNLFLAPIAGFSDAAFRYICIDNGASLGFTEMVSCEGLIRNSEKTFQLLKRADNEDFLAIQIFTGSADTAFKAASTLCEFNPDIIDLNCGCPVPKVIKNGAGSALMNDPEKLGEIIVAIKEGASKCNKQRPNISVKIRLGWDSNKLNYLQIANKAVDSGAEMISLHSRTRAQGYSGKADHAHTKNLKENINVPIIASGDLFSANDAQDVFAQTGCDGILFSRGSFGNPWIFKQTIELLTNKKNPRQISNIEKAETAKKHLLIAAKLKGETIACREMKKQLCSYTKGSKGAAALRNSIVHANKVSEYIEILDTFSKQK